MMQNLSILKNVRFVEASSQHSELGLAQVLEVVARVGR
jgi:hypothetical protein